MPRKAPLPSSHEMHKAKTRWAEKYDFETRLGHIKPFCEAGVTAAVHDAWILVRDNGICPPKWLVEPTIAQLRRSLSDKKSSRSYAKRYMRDFYRWRAVEELRELGRSKESALIEACECLDKFDQYRVGPDRMEECYDLVQRELANPKRAFLYYSAMRETRTLMGIEVVPENMSERQG